MKRLNLIAGLIVVLLVSTVGLFAQQDAEQEFQQLYQEYMQLNQQLQGIQQQALENDEIAAKAEEYTKLIDKKLVEKDGELSQLIEQRDSIMNDIEDAQEKGDMETMERLHPDYQQISEQLQPHINEVMVDEEIIATREGFESVLIDKMMEIEPNTAQLLTRLDQITENLQAIMMQME